MCFVDVRRNCLFIESVTSLCNSSDESNAALREVPHDEMIIIPQKRKQRKEKADILSITAFFSSLCEDAFFMYYSALGGCQEPRFHFTNSILAFPTYNFILARIGILASSSVNQPSNFPERP